jgi:hypothetical protein
MMPEKKLEFLRTLLEHGVEVRTLRKSKRVVAVEKIDSQVVLRYEDGSADRMHIRDFARRRFVVML